MYSLSSIRFNLMKLYKNGCCPSNMILLAMAQRYKSLPAVSYRENSENRHRVGSGDEEDHRKLFYKSDPDTFGNLLGIKQLVNDNIEYEADKREEEYLNYKPMKSQQLSTKQYADLIKGHVEHMRIKEAIDVLEVKMIKEDRVFPENYIYNIVIGACGDVGYTKQAFKLYNDMKRRNLKVTGATYTCLFTACANSPWPADGLAKARHLRALMKEKLIEPNLTNYNAMIKAFGRCGDLSTAFEIVDEMVSKKIKIRVHTFNFLLQSCISDKKFGLKYGFIVWRKILQRREKPNIYTFNLMLKCVKDCELGDTTSFSELNKYITNEGQSSSKLNSISQLKPAIQSAPSNSESDIALSNSTSQNLIEKRYQEDIPSFLSKTLQMGPVIGINKVKTTEDKFLLVGGKTGFLKEMTQYSVKPDIKTFTQMLHLLPKDLSSELELLDTMKQYDVKPDIDFYNMLIKNRCFRNDYDNAKKVLELINQDAKERKRKYFFKKKLHLHPNIMTYGVLALACRTNDDAEKLLTEMHEAKLKINIEIMGTLLSNGINSINFGYVMYIMDEVRRENLNVNSIFLKHLDNFFTKCEERKRMQPVSQSFLKYYGIFSDRFDDWLKEVNIEKAVTKIHPWQQFREAQPETIQRPSVVVKKPRKYKEPMRFAPIYKVKL